jgi:hypothetical protein
MSALGRKTTRVFATAAATCGEAGEPFNPIVFFLCALDAVDPDGTLAPLPARRAALSRTLHGPERYGPTTVTSFERFVEGAFRQTALAGHTVVRPVDVLRAALDIAEAAITDAFSGVDVRRAFRLDEIEQLVPAGVLADESEPAALMSNAVTADAVPSFEVVVSGPDFCDRANRYATLVEAQWAANSLSVRAFGSAMFPPPHIAEQAGSTIAIVVPRRLQEATRIEIKEV